MNIKKIYLTARTEYIKWLFDPRMIIIGVMIIFIYDLSVFPLSGMAMEMKDKLNIFEPFVAVTNSDLLIIMIPGVFLTLVSDFPKTDGSTLFFLQRTDRINWVLGQVLFIVFAGITFIAVIFAASVLPILDTASFENTWSHTVMDYRTKFPERSLSFGAGLITENLTYQISPLSAAVQSSVLVMLYLIVLSEIMLVFSTLGIKIMGLVTSAGVIAMGGALCAVNTSAKWIFPMSHTIIWLHKTKFFRQPVMELWKSYLYFIVLIVIMLLLSCAFIDSTNFDSVSDLD